MLGLAGALGCGDGPSPGADIPTGAAVDVSGEDGRAPIEPLATADEDLAPPAWPDWIERPEDWAAQHPVLSPNAKLESHLVQLAETRIEHDPADGAGRAWLAGVTPVDRAPEPMDDRGRRRPAVPAGSHQRFAIGFEVGPLGIREGGLLFVVADPFWDWSPAQTIDPLAPGHTTATTRAAGVVLEPDGPDATFRVTGRALDAGERVDIVYGAGPDGARVDRYAERGAEILIGVDADGDGVRAWLPESVQVDVVAREGAALRAFGPAELAPGAALELRLGLLDVLGNRARWPGPGDDGAGPARARIRVTRQPGSTTTLEVEADGREVELEAEADGAMRRVIGRVAGPGVLRLRVEGRDELAGFVADVPPIVVREAARRLVWADLHGHSRYSDGTGEPADWFAYARDVAGLDAVALTDHDHWGVRPLAESPAHQADILASVRRFHEPGRFVTLPGYEWTSWLHGHRHVLYFEEPAPIFSAFDPETDRPDELWDALRGRPALTFAHHTAGEPVATNWRFAPDPELETLVEVASVHGVSEAADAPQPVEGGIPGHFARDALRRGYRLGFVGSGDSHDGHPGLAEIAAGRAGLAGIFTDALDRPALLDAMRRRHTFATNGIRPWLEVSLDGVAMGGELEASSDAPMHRLHVRYEATAPIARLDLVRSGHVLRLDPAELGLDAPDALALDLAREIPVLGPGEFHYVRILQTDGGIAWSSPIFARAPQAPIQRLRNTKKAAPSRQSAARR